MTECTLSRFADRTEWGGVVGPKAEVFSSISGKVVQRDVELGVFSLGGRMQRDGLIVSENYLCKMLFHRFFNSTRKYKTNLLK